MKDHVVAVLAALILFAPAAWAQAQSPQSILAMLPAPTHGDCSGAEGQKHDAALTAFEQQVAALEAAEQAKLAALSAEMQKVAAADPMAMVLRDPRQTMALHQWMTEPGRRELGATGEALFKPAVEKANAAEQPIDLRARKCEERDGCDPKPILLQRQPIRDALWATTEKAWPQFVAMVRKDLAWDAESPPSSIDAKKLPVRMQLRSRSGLAVADLEAAANMARRYGCVQTAKLESPAH